MWSKRAVIALNRTDSAAATVRFADLAWPDTASVRDGLLTVGCRCK